MFEFGPSAVFSISGTYVVTACAEIFWVLAAFCDDKHTIFGRDQVSSVSSMRRIGLFSFVLMRQSSESNAEFVYYCFSLLFGLGFN